LLPSGQKVRRRSGRDPTLLSLKPLPPREVNPKSGVGKASGGGWSNARVPPPPGCELVAGSGRAGKKSFCHPAELFEQMTCLLRSCRFFRGILVAGRWPGNPSLLPGAGPAWKSHLLAFPLNLCPHFGHKKRWTRYFCRALPVDALGAIKKVTGMKRQKRLQ
jgi:hypothetical protein